MKKFIFLIVCFSLFVSPLMASTEFSASALEWWLRSQGKFEGAAVSTQETKQGSREFEITHWAVSGVEKPTDEQVETIIDEYNDFLVTDKQSKSNSVKNVLTKLGLTKEEAKVIKDYINSKEE